MADVPINVKLDKEGGIRCVPDPAKARRGNNTIVWRAITPGVELVSIEITQGPGHPVWPGSKPSRKSDGSITASDPVEGTKKETFKYSVTVRRDGETFEVDPELENDPNP